MKQLIVLFFVLAIGINPSISFAQKNYNSKRHSPDIEDKVKKKPLAFYAYDSEFKVFYYVSNDEENVYLNLKLRDESAQQKVLMYGLTVYMKPNVKHKKLYSLVYPISFAPDISDRKPPKGKKSGDNNKELKEQLSRLLLQFDEIETKGFEDSKEPSYFPVNSKDFSGKIFFNEEDELIYQLRVSVDKFPPFSSNKEKSLMLSFKSGSADKDLSQEVDKPSGGGMQSGGPGGGGGGGRGGGSGGGPGGGGSGGGGISSGGGMDSPSQMDEKDDLSTPINIKLKKIVLSQAPKRN